MAAMTSSSPATPARARTAPKHLVAELGGLVDRVQREQVSGNGQTGCSCIAGARLLSTDAAATTARPNPVCTAMLRISSARFAARWVAPQQGRGEAVAVGHGRRRTARLRGRASTRARSSHRRCRPNPGMLATSTQPWNSADALRAPRGPDLAQAARTSARQGRPPSADALPYHQQQAAQGHPARHPRASRCTTSAASRKTRAGDTWMRRGCARPAAGGPRAASCGIRCAAAAAKGEYLADPTPPLWRGWPGFGTAIRWPKSVSSHAPWGPPSPALAPAMSASGHVGRLRDQAKRPNCPTIAAAARPTRVSRRRRRLTETAISSAGIPSNMLGCHENPERQRDPKTDSRAATHTPCHGSRPAGSRRRCRMSAAPPRPALRLDREGEVAFGLVSIDRGGMPDHPVGPGLQRLQPDVRDACCRPSRCASADGSDFGTRRRPAP